MWPNSKKGHRLRLSAPPVALLKLLRAYSGGAAYGDPQDNSDYYRDKINGREDVQARGECLASGTTRCWR
jgi:hypothetical protein